MHLMLLQNCPNPDGQRFYSGQIKMKSHQMKDGRVRRFNFCGISNFCMSMTTLIDGDE